MAGEDGSVYGGGPGSVRRGSSYGDFPADQTYGQPMAMGQSRVRNDSFAGQGSIAGGAGSGGDGYRYGSPLVQTNSRTGSIGTTHSTGWNSQAATAYGGPGLAPPISGSGSGSGLGSGGGVGGYDGSQGQGQGLPASGSRPRVQSSLVPQEDRERNVQTQYSQYSQYSDAAQYRDSTIERGVGRAV